MSLFKEFGTIKDFDFMWHTHGPRKGEPRGYCFVEYMTREDAERATRVMDGKLIQGKPLHVRFALEKDVDDRTASQSVRDNPQAIAKSLERSRKQEYPPPTPPISHSGAAR